MPLACSRPATTCAVTCSKHQDAPSRDAIASAVNSAYDAQSDEVYALEELVGSHGGMGGPQSFPFILIPTPWAVPDQTIVGAESMHQWMRRWLKDLGHTEYVETPSAPVSAG